MNSIELRDVQIGKDKLQVAVSRREDGKAVPRAMIAGISAGDLVDVVGATNFYHGNQLEFARRVDTSDEVAHAISAGQVEIGIVKDVPEPMIEGVGVYLETPYGTSGENLAVIGKVSSKLELTQ